MTTIDKIDIGVYVQYARRMQMIEEINQQYRFYEASTIPPQTQLFDVYPKLTELDLLLGVVPVATPWAYFFPPKIFRAQRRSPFAFHRVAPSLGTGDQQEELIGLLEMTSCHTPEEEQEKEALLSCLKQVGKLNEWLSYIIGRVGQFLQG